MPILPLLGDRLLVRLVERLELSSDRFQLHRAMQRGILWKRRQIGLNGLTQMRFWGHAHHPEKQLKDAVSRCHEG
jgi:hypothetical protein